MNGRWIVIFAIVALATACTDDAATAPNSAVVAVTSTTQAARIDDGVLRIGLLLPDSGDAATIGKPLIAAALSAQTAINASGGVLGKRVEIVGGVDEGSTPSTAREAIVTLAEQGVDAVVGPASSNIALATIPQLMAAGILTCSPTATALALDELPGRSLFFRTAPSDSLEAMAIAEQADRTGALSAVVVFLDDAYGRPLAKATIAALRSRGLTVEDPVGFDADDEVLKDEATAVGRSDPGVIIVLGSAEQGARMIAAIGDGTQVGASQEAPPIIVNDALRRPPSPELITSLTASLRDRVIGVSPLASAGAPGEPSGAYAVNAFDCVNLIALAAAQARSDDPAAIAAQMSLVSERGVTCQLFAQCIGLLDAGRNIDYDGPDGWVQIGSDGDPVRARFDRWGWNEDGTDVSLPIGPLSVSR